MKSYNYEITYKNIIDETRGYLIYEFNVNDITYTVELNVRPDDLNGGNELELLYKANGDYQKTKAENIWKLYYTLSTIYLEGLKEFILNGVNITHFKIKGFLTGNGEKSIDKRKDRIGVSYIKKYCNITDTFEDIEYNTILKIDQKNPLK